MTDRDTLKLAVAATPQCLSAAQLESLVDGKHSDPHLAECVRCQSELAMLKSFEAAEPLPQEGAAVAWISAHLDRQLEAIKSPSRGHLGRTATAGFARQGSWLARVFGVGSMRWVLPAAVMATAVVAAVVALKPARAPELQASNNRQQEIYRSQEVQLVTPMGDVQQPPTELRWQSFPSAVVYKVVLMEIDHSQLWASETKGPAAEIPLALRGKLLPGKPILWQVTAMDTQSQVIGTSQVQEFRLVRAASSKTLPSSHD
jgi:hypothetical protein